MEHLPHPCPDETRRPESSPRGRHPHRPGTTQVRGLGVRRPGLWTAASGSRQRGGHRVPGGRGRDGQLETARAHFPHLRRPGGPDQDAAGLASGEAPSGLTAGGLSGSLRRGQWGQWGWQGHSQGLFPNGTDPSPGSPLHRPRLLLSLGDQVPARELGGTGNFSPWQRAPRDRNKWWHPWVSAEWQRVEPAAIRRAIGSGRGVGTTADLPFPALLLRRSTFLRQECPTHS